MPRFTYQDWVHRKAKAERRLSNQAGITYEIGDVVLITGYDRRSRFFITSPDGGIKGSMWGVEPYKLALIDGAGETIRQKILTYLIRSNAFGAVWVGAPDIARSVNEGLPSVSSLLKMMADQHLIKRRKGEGKRGGYGYKPKLQHLEGISRYDRLMSDRDILTVLGSDEPP